MLKLSNIFFIFTIYTAYGIVLIDGFESKYTSPSPLYSIGSPTPNNKRFVQIYIPDHYFDSEDEYPVIYFLHGFGQNYSSHYKFLTLVDELIKKGKIPPLIVIKPDGMVLGHLGSFYTNSELGKFQDYIMYELLPYIETKYRIKKTPNNRALIGYGMGVCGALLYACSTPYLFGSISCHITECSLICPAILEQMIQMIDVEQKKNNLNLDTFNIMNGPTSFLCKAFEISQYNTIFKSYFNAMPINNIIDQLIIESINTDSLLQKAASQIKEIVQNKHIDPIMLNTFINNNDYSFNFIPLYILWPAIKNAIETLPPTIPYNGLPIQKEAIIALLSIGVDPFDYVTQNNYVLLTAEKIGIKPSAIFNDIPSAVSRLQINSKLFSIESDDEEERFKETLILHGLYFLKS